MNARLTALEPSYHTTLPSMAGRELPEDGRTVDLRTVTVEVEVEKEGQRSHFEFTYHADHERRELEMRSVEPLYSDHAPAAELSRAADLADDAVHAWLVDIEKELRLENTLSSPGVRGDADVFTELEVAAAASGVSDD